MNEVNDSIPILRTGGGKDSVSANNCDPTFVNLYDEVAAATVQIYGKGKTGSGFFVGDGSEVVTNFHVGAGEKNLLQVVTKTGEVLEAHLEKIDDINDLAVLKLEHDRKSEHVLPLGSSFAMHRHDPVFAVGHPNGDQNTYISAGTYNKDMTFIDAVPKEFPDSGVVLAKVSMLPNVLEDAGKFNQSPRIGTDAQVEHGNSGGPLVDAQGRVIGVTTEMVEHNNADGPLLGAGGKLMGLYPAFDSPSLCVPVEKVQALLDRKDPKFNCEYQQTNEWSSSTKIEKEILAVRDVFSVAASVALPPFRTLLGVFSAFSLKRDLSMASGASDEHEKNYGLLGVLSDAALIVGAGMSVASRWDPELRAVSLGATLAGLAFADAQPFVERKTLVSIKRTDGEKRQPLFWGDYPSIGISSLINSAINPIANDNPRHAL